MTTQLPRYQTGVGVVETEGTISFGNNLPISFNGNNSFSFAGWFQITEEEPTGFIINKNQEFALGLNDGVLYAQLAGQVTPTAANFVLDNDWHYIVVTFATTGSQGGTLTLYMDGAQVAQSILNNVGTGNQGSPLQIGGNVYLNVWCLCVFSTALSQASTDAMWEPQTSGAGLVASYAFMKAPPSDISGNNNPISFSSGSSEQVTTPGVNLQNTAYCGLSSLDGINPGNAGNDPYTIQAWIYPQQGIGPQYIFSNGLADVSTVSLYLTEGSSPGQLVLNATHGQDNLSGGNLSTNAWSNVAVTYDGQTLTLYLNGAVLGSTASGSITPIAQPALLLGAAASQSAIPNMFGFFQGVIQSVDVWNVAISATQLTTDMLTEPYGQGGCLAIYTLTDTASNGVTGSSIGFYNGAALDSLTISVSTTDAQQLYERAQQLKAALPPPPPRRSVSTNATGVTIKPLSDAQIRRAIAVFDEMFPASLDAETRKAMRERFVSDLNKANQSLANGKPIPGTITHQLEGDDFVFYHHHAEGAEEVLRLPAATTTQCTAWFVSVFATIIVGFLGVFSVPFTSSRVTAAVARIFNNTALGRAVAQVFNEEVTGRTIIQALVIVFTAGSLTNIISQILADLSWWDFLFVVGGVVLQFIEIMFPNPTSAVFYGLIMSKMALMVVQVNLVIAQKPTGC